MIKLRDFTENDLEALLKQANNPNVARYLTERFPSPYTKADAKQWISTGCKDGITKVIEYQNNFAGSVGATPLKGEHRFSASVGYWLGEEYWGKGIASKALNIFTDEMFLSTEIVRLHAKVYSPNTASMKVLEKSGYLKEAILRQYVFKNGEFYDGYIYAKIKPSQ